MKVDKQNKRPSSILVVITRRIGDVLLTTPVIRALRQAWPDARIDALVFAGTEGVLESNPDINEVITVVQRPTIRQHIKLIQRICRNYDIAISMMPSDRPTLYACLAGKQRIGLISSGKKHWWKRALLSKYALFDNIDTHSVLINLALVDLLGVPRCHQVVADLKLENEKTVRTLLPFDPEAHPYVVLHMYPMYAYKAWRREAWIELAEWLHSEGMKIVLTGGKDKNEIAYVNKLKGLLPHDTVDLAGKLNLASVTYLISKARAYVGPDTVVTHLAAATGTPTVALFGPSNPVKWGPWPMGYNKNSNPYKMKGTQRVNNVIVLQGEGDCVPCMEEGCERHINSLSDCLQNLPSARVIDSLSSLLNRPL